MRKLLASILAVATIVFGLFVIDTAYAQMNKPSWAYFLGGVIALVLYAFLMVYAGKGIASLWKWKSKAKSKPFCKKSGKDCSKDCC
jgi:hypothetical protein